MSWYGVELNYKNFKQADKVKRNGCSFSIFQNEEVPVTITLKILNMNSLSDYEIIYKGLSSEPGILKVFPYLRDKKLIISYNARKLSVDHIVYKLAALGFQCFKRV